MRAVLHCSSFEVAVLAVEVSRTVAGENHVLALGINGGLGYLMVSASLSPARMRFLKGARNLIPMELLSAITNSVPSITRHVIFDVKKCGAYMRMDVMTLVNRDESGIGLTFSLGDDARRTGATGKGRG